MILNLLFCWFALPHTHTYTHLLFNSFNKFISLILIFFQYERNDYLLCYLLWMNYIDDYNTQEIFINENSVCKYLNNLEKWMHNNNENVELTMVCCVKEMNDEKETSEHFKRILSKQRTTTKNRNFVCTFVAFVCVDRTDNIYYSTGFELATNRFFPRIYFYVFFFISKDFGGFLFLC